VKISVEPIGGGRRAALVVGVAVLLMLTLPVFGARARAAERIYWTNFEAGPSQSIGFANTDGTGGGALAVPTAVDPEAEQMAFDPVNGRLYVASVGAEQILWVSLDGSGSGVVDTHGAKVLGVAGVAVDPRTQTLYWGNDASGKAEIAWAQLEGSASGTLNTTGATGVLPIFLALDIPDGRLYWISRDKEGGSHFSWANLDNSGGGDLTLSGTPNLEEPDGLAVDPGAGRLYWADDGGAQRIAWANLSGVGGGTVPVPGATLIDPFGLAFDPSGGRLYWGNFGIGEQALGALATTTLSGGGGPITPVGAPVDGPQYPLVLKSPAGTGVPQVTQNVAALSCSQGSWSQDYQGSGVFGAPISYSYQWTLNGQAISGATGSSYTATAGGSYSCQVTGKNQTGSATQASSAVTVAPAALTATLQSTKAHAKAGKAAVVKLQLANGGQIASMPVTVCAALAKAAKKALIAPKCASIGGLGSGGSTVLALTIKTKKSAKKGTYKLTTLVNGATVAPVTVSIKVTAPKHKKKRRKHHHKK
jgi:hypothetical protein